MQRVVPPSYTILLIKVWSMQVVAPPSWRVINSQLDRGRRRGKGGVRRGGGVRVEGTHLVIDRLY